MRTIDKNKPVLVTGGAGYLASWIIKILLDDGLDVNATVRDPADSEKIAHLEELARTSRGRLRFFEADLLAKDSFDASLRDCELVIHTASPFFITGIKDPERELIQPAQAGTRNVLEAATRTATVKRVVLTSSVAALYGDNADISSTQGGIFTENDWNETSSEAHQPYSYSKTIAEKEAWKIAEGQSQWDLVVINPGWILGPSLTQRTDSMSIKTMLEFGNGTYKSGVPQLWTSIVDVRDVARAHVKAGFTPEARGRHILVSGERTLLDLALILRDKFGDDYPFPRREAPKSIFWLIAPLYGRTRKYVSLNVGIPIRFDNRYSQKDLGISYRPVEQTVQEHFQQIVDNGLLG
ncbi:MAG: aldehyde reductase [Desulfobacterales bacterium]|nr:aldehyde reductase [Desulfobacterales bacterium]